MESIQGIKSRIGAVKNVGQITKAMELVAATKMRKSQEVALRSRPYAFAALELFEKLAHFAPTPLILAKKEVLTKTLVVILASDRGLTGSFNAQVFKAADAFFASDAMAKNPHHGYAAVAIGKKAASYASSKKLLLVKSFYGAGDYVLPQETYPIAQLLAEGFYKGRWDRVVVISTHFRTTLKQETMVRQLLPMELAKIRETISEIIPERGRFSEERGLWRKETAKKMGEIEYLFEPSPEEALQLLMPHLLAMQLYHIVLEANASEHSTRRVAMKTASDNADELSGVLTLSFNKARQASITKELIEITSTQNALVSE